jgi:hypothetical protein
MLTLNLQQANPFIESYNLMDNNQNLINLSKMPRTYPTSPNPISTPIIDRKRKFNEEFEITTPIRSNSNSGSLITPPRSHKKFKTAPSSPINTDAIYETPKTPSFKQHNLLIPSNNNNNHNINKISLNNNFDYSVTSPEFYSHSTNFDVDVTPPQSVDGSPKISNISINLPTVQLNKINPGNEFMYLYPDTCYPFNIAGSAIGKSDGNLKLKTWRNACNEKVRHEYNKAIKDYNVLSERYNATAMKTIKETSSNIPSIYNRDIFPSFNLMNDNVNQGLTYPSINKDINSKSNSNSNINIEEEARILLSIKHKDECIKRKATFPLHESKNIKLPSINEIFKLTPIDKSTIHPSGLSAFEIDQYKDPNIMGISLDKNSTEFYNGKEIRTGQKFTYISQHEKIKTQSQNLIHQNYNNQQYSNYNNTSLINYKLDYVPYSNQPTVYHPINYTQQQINSNQTPINQQKNNSVTSFSVGANAFDALNKEVNDINSYNDDKNTNIINPNFENFKKFQTKFKTQPLKVHKTRRNSHSVNKNKKASSTSTSSSSKSSRKSSRKSSSSSIKSLSNNNTVSTKIQMTTEYRYRTRSRTSSENSSRSVSIESTKTAEAPASIQSTPKRRKSDVQHEFGNNEINNINHHHYTLLNPKEAVLSIIPIKAQPYIHKHINNTSNTQKHSHISNTSNNNNNNNTYFQRTSKKCMSCHSTSSPCWRPSWSPDDGQLCNSCGLRYRKTKARCYNPNCLKIPSKSEWALMLKRGKVMLDVYNEVGIVKGQEMCYRCLDCDHAMEVLK